MSKNTIKYDIRTTISPDGVIKQDLLSEDDRGMALISRQVINTKEEKLRQALIELGWKPPGGPMPDVYAKSVAREREAKERAMARCGVMMSAIARLIDQGAKCCFVDNTGHSLVRNAAYAHLLELATSDEALPREARQVLDALRFYADKSNHRGNPDADVMLGITAVDLDAGHKAREALGIYD